MSFFSSTPTDLDGPLEYGITGDAMHIILRGGMLNSLIIKSTLFLQVPTRLRTLALQVHTRSPTLTVQKISPVNKNLIQFNNKDCGTMIIDITLECFYC